MIQIQTLNIAILASLYTQNTCAETNNNQSTSDFILAFYILQTGMLTCFSVSLFN